MAGKARRTKETGERPRKAGRRRRAAAEETPKPASDKEPGFRFDAYWDEAFDAYFDPTLRTCCQLRY
jgi:hypothetical protein